MRPALLALSDGTTLRGEAFGAEGETFGEVVFNTSLTGYQEILTDPSYHGQIVTMTCPHQGNYGLNSLDDEASVPWVRGFCVREHTPRPSSWRAEESLDEYMRRHGIVGIAGVDTRMLTRRVRVEGAMGGAVSTHDTDAASLVGRVRSARGILGVDLVREVTPATPYDADPEELAASGTLDPSSTPDERVRGARVAAIDYGMKRNILRCLVAKGFVVRVFPAHATKQEILAFAPDGVFLSNGPGDPSAVPYAVETIRGVLNERVPTFGICLGHQLLGTALGGSTYKLKFGHRGANHPVKSLTTGRVEITTQNHGFAVDAGRRPDGEEESWRTLVSADQSRWVWESQCGSVQLTHFDLNDGTLEGLRALDVPAYSVQYHPEAAPGPHDARYLFDDFADLVARGKGGLGE